MISLFILTVVLLLPAPNTSGISHVYRQAAVNMKGSIREVSSFCKKNGIPADLTHDPAQTGLIGPELTDSAMCILNEINDNSPVKFSLVPVEAGDNSLTKFGNALPEFTLSTIRKSDACLKGPVGESAAEVILVIRQLFDLYANIRPLKAYPNTNSLRNNIDLVVVRENTEDLYLGWEFWSDDETVISLRRTSKKAIERITQYAFKMAKW